MKYLFVDTETNGLPHKGIQPRMIQLAWILYDNDTLIDSYVSFIYPDGWAVPKEDFWTKNRLSTEICEKKGIPVHKAIEEFLIAANTADYFIAHNVDFDFNVIKAEMNRLGLYFEKSISKLCTKALSQKYCNATDIKGRVKGPSLEELHEKLFNEKFEGAHDALNDVRACAKSFFELQRRGVIKL